MSGWVVCPVCGNDVEPIDAGRGRLSCPACGEELFVVTLDVREVVVTDE